MHPENAAKTPPLLVGMMIARFVCWKAGATTWFLQWQAALRCLKKLLQQRKCLAAFKRVRPFVRRQMLVSVAVVFGVTLLPLVLHLPSLRASVPTWTIRVCCAFRWQKTKTNHFYEKTFISFLINFKCTNDGYDRHSVHWQAKCSNICKIVFNYIFKENTVVS